LQTPVWRHEIRVEKITLLQEDWLGPRCIAGAGTPPPEPVASPQEFDQMKDLFTPAYILHRLAEMPQPHGNLSGWRRHGRYVQFTA
jgi:hypothetical protein